MFIIKCIRDNPFLTVLKNVVLNHTSYSKLEESDIQMIVIFKLIHTVLFLNRVITELNKRIPIISDFTVTLTRHQML